MASWRNESVDQLCDAILSLRSREECCAFLEDVCTIREIQDLSQRLEVARMILDGTSYSIITRETGASTATISRVRKCCDYGAGGYQTVINRLNQEKHHD